MKRINAAYLGTAFGLLRTVKVPVQCDECRWRGVRTIKIYTDLCDNPFGESAEEANISSAVSREQAAIAIAQSCEMRSIPECPHCGSDDVYHCPKKRKPRP